MGQYHYTLIGSWLEEKIGLSHTLVSFFGAAPAGDWVHHSIVDPFFPGASFEAYELSSP